MRLKWPSRSKRIFEDIEYVEKDYCDCSSDNHSVCDVRRSGSVDHGQTVRQEHGTYHSV